MLYNIFWEISLYLPAYRLLLCSELKSLYNQHWFKIVLITKYPEIQFQDNDNFRRLYYRDLHSYNIFLQDPSQNPTLIATAVKMIASSSHSLLLLTFNDECYEFQNKRLNRIDTDVKDIGGDCYIKGCTWYARSGNTNNQFVSITADEPFIACGWITAVTKDCVYMFDDMDFYYKKLEGITGIIHNTFVKTIDGKCYLPQSDSDPPDMDLVVENFLEYCIDESDSYCVMNETLYQKGVQVINSYLPSLVSGCHDKYGNLYLATCRPICY